MLLDILDVGYERKKGGKDDCKVFWPDLLEGRSCHGVKWERLGFQECIRS